MGFSISNLMNSISGDSTILRSVGDYLTKKFQKTGDFISAISTALSDDAVEIFDEVGSIVPELVNEIGGFTVSEKVYNVMSSDVINAVYQEFPTVPDSTGQTELLLTDILSVGQISDIRAIVSSYIDSHYPDFTDVVFMFGKAGEAAKGAWTKDAICACLCGSDFVYNAATNVRTSLYELIDQLTDRYNAGVALVESLYAMARCSFDNTVDVIADFKNRIELKLGGLTSSVCQYGYTFINVLQSKGMSVRSKVESLLRFVGLISDEVNPIGPPVNAYDQRFGSCMIFDAAIVTIESVAGDAVKAAFALVFNTIGNALRQIWTSITGSKFVQDIKKFGTVLSSESDSFSVTGDSKIFGPYISNMPQTLGFVYSDISSSDIIAKLNDVGELVYGLNWVPISTCADPLSNFEAMNYDSEFDYNGDFVYSVRRYKQLYGYDTILGDLRGYVQWIIGDRSSSWRSLSIYMSTRYQNYDIDTIMGCIGLLVDTLSYGHPSASSIGSQVSDSNYLQFDLPCSTIQVWRVDNTVYCNRYIKAIPNAAAIATSIPNQLGGRVVNIEDFFTHIAALDNYSNVQIENDNEMLKSVVGAHIIDGMYIDIINTLAVDPDATFIMNTTDGGSSNLTIRVGNTELNCYPTIAGVELLTSSVVYDPGFGTYGVNADSYVMGGGFLAAHITGLLCPNSIDSVRTLRNGVKFMSGSSVNSAITTLINMTYDDQFYVPYVRAYEPIQGYYNVMTQSELASYVVKIMVAIIVVEAVVATVVLLGAIKKAAFEADAKAGALSWDAVGKPGRERDMIVAYKAHKKSVILSSVVSGITGAVSSSVKGLASAVTNVVSSGVNMVRNGLSSDDNIVAGAVDNGSITLKSIKNLISTR